MAAETPLWTPGPDRIEKSELKRFMAMVAERTGAAFETYDDIHRWSVDNIAEFWSAVWDFAGVVGDKGGRLLDDPDRMPGAAFFPEARLNFAENLLTASGGGDAFVFWGEDKVRRRMSWDELRDLVSRLQQAFAAEGVGPGDRIAAMMPNMPETIAAMLAAASLGAIWSSCSPDFGEQGVLDRFGQIEPKLLIASDGYWYNGKEQAVGPKLASVAEKLTSASKTIVVPYLGKAEAVAETVRGGVDLGAFLRDYQAKPVEYTRMPFSHPLYILFSSGTTGIPKCIVHSAGGTLLKHATEHRLQSDVRPGDRVFYFTTCGWMMWNWLASGLSCGATLLLYDGSPFAPDGNILFDFADAEKATLFGTSAKFIDAVKKAGLRPIDSHDLGSVRLITSTGSPLAPESFEYVYDGIKRDVHLASISGGTDIVGCFVLGNPLSPVWIGEIQGPALGMAVDVWDDEGNPVRGEKGELVCTKPFVTMPVKFWNDPDGAKYHAAYFDRFDNVWCHGDFAEWTEHGGMVIHGRSDATLNPGGVRIGTAEIYNQVEQMDEVVEAIAIGQQWDGDVRVVLFVRLAEGVTLDEDLIKAIKSKIRTGASPRHVPAKVVAVADIPRTKSGKITELAVRDVVHGRAVKNVEALANPEALELFKDLVELTG